MVGKHPWALALKSFIVVGVLGFSMSPSALKPSAHPFTNSFFIAPQLHFCRARLRLQINRANQLQFQRDIAVHLVQSIYEIL